MDRLIAYKHLLSKAQKEQIVRELATGSGQGVHIQLTKAQQGGFLGSLLTSIGVPILLNALTGKGRSRGLQVEPAWSGRGLQVGPPPSRALNAWGRPRLVLGKNSPFKGIPLLGDIL